MIFMKKEDSTCQIWQQPDTGSGNGLVLTGAKPIPGPILTKMPGAPFTNMD